MGDDIRFEIKDKEYSAGRLDAKRQFHITRRLGPFIGSIAKDGDFNSLKEEAVIAALLDVAAEMPDESLDYVIDNCLGVAKRKDGPLWANITTLTPSGERILQYQDIDDMVSMLTIVFHVLKGNMSGFFDALPSDFADKVKENVSALSK